MRFLLRNLLFGQRGTFTASPPAPSGATTFDSTLDTFDATTWTFDEN